MRFYFLSVLHRNHTDPDSFNIFSVNLHLLIFPILVCVKSSLRWWSRALKVSQTPDDETKIASSHPYEHCLLLLSPSTVQNQAKIRPDWLFPIQFPGFWTAQGGASLDLQTAASSTCALVKKASSQNRLIESHFFTCNYVKSRHFFFSRFADCIFHLVPIVINSCVRLSFPRLVLRSS